MSDVCSLLTEHTTIQVLMESCVCCCVMQKQDDGTPNSPGGAVRKDRDGSPLAHTTGSEDRSATLE